MEGGLGGEKCSANAEGKCWEQMQGSKNAGGKCSANAGGKCWDQMLGASAEANVLQTLGGKCWGEMCCNVAKHTIVLRGGTSVVSRAGGQAGGGLGDDQGERAPGELVRRGVWELTRGARAWSAARAWVGKVGESASLSSTLGKLPSLQPKTRSWSRKVQNKFLAPRIFLPDYLHIPFPTLTMTQTTLQKQRHCTGTLDASHLRAVTRPSPRQGGDNEKGDGKSERRGRRNKREGS